MPRVHRVCLVAGDEPATEHLVRQLQAQGFDVRLYAEGTTALAGAEGFWPDVVVVDLGLSGTEGLGVLERLYRLGGVPILALTPPGGTRLGLRHLEGSADARLTKPCDPASVVARIRALLHRANRLSSSVLVAGGLRVDRLQGTASVGDRLVNLSPREADVLFVLVQAQNRVLTRRQILDLVWGPGTDVDLRVVDAFVTRVRRKLAPVGHCPPWEITTVWRVGYRFMLGSEGSGLGAEEGP